MKERVCSLVLLVALASWFELARAASPDAVTYQGRLIEEAGPANGARTIVFEIFALQAGGTGLFCETNSPLCSDGLFSTVLGASNPSAFVAALAGGEAWLQVSVGGQPLGGRQRLLAAPYAIHAGSAPLAAGSVSNIHLAAGAVTSTKLAAGAVTAAALAEGAVTAGALAEGAVTAAALAGGEVGAMQMAGRLTLGGGPLMVTNPVAYESGFFGGAVADLGANGFLVGASGDDVVEQNAGAVYWFNADGSFRMTVTNPAASQGDYFGGVLAGLGGGRFAVGVPAEWAGAYQSGAVHLFAPGGSCLLTITNPVPAEEARFGSAVAAVGADRFVVGAGGAKAAYLYGLDGTLLRAVTNPVANEQSGFGWAVAGVGADGFAVGGSTGVSGVGGVVHLFSAGGACLLTVTNPTPSTYDCFGESVARVGPDRFVVGAYGDDAGAEDSGAAHLYGADGRHIMTVTNPTPAAGDQFGRYVAGVGSDKFIVGSYMDDAGATNAGVAHLYWADGRHIMTVTNPAPVDSDYFGMAVGGAGTGRFVVGAPGRDRGAGLGNAGAAWLYKTDFILQDVAVEHVAAGAVTASALADGAVTASALAAGAVTASAMAAGSVGSDALSAGAVTASALSAGAVTASALAAGSVGSNALAARAVTAQALADGAVSAQSMAGSTVIAPGGLVLDDHPMGSDQFGGAVAGLGGGRFLVGSYRDAAGGSNGDVDLYGPGGSCLLTVTNPAPVTFSGFGTALARVGQDRFLVGDYRGAQGAEEAGAAYLYRSDGTCLLAVTNPVPAPGDHFGKAVAGVGADRFAVGAPDVDAGAITNAGAVYLYSDSGTLLATLTNPAPAAYDLFGGAVAALGTERFVVGAPGDVYGSVCGKAYLYSTAGTLLLAVTNPAPDRYDQFGYAAAGVGADRFVVGAPWDDAGAVNSGAAYVYRADGTLLATLANPAPAYEARFGSVVTAVGPDKFLVGAPGNPLFSTGAGEAHLYWADGTHIGPVINPSPSEDDEFACAAAAVDADRFVVCVRRDDTGGRTLARRGFSPRSRSSTGCG